MNRIFIVLALFVLSSCGPMNYCSIPHSLEGSLTSQDRIRELQNLYIQIRKPQFEDTSGMKFEKSKSVWSDVKNPLPVSEIVAPLAKELEKQGGHVWAYRVVTSAETDDVFLTHLNPNSFLTCEIHYQSSDSEEVKTDIKKKNSQGVESTETLVSWETQVGVTVEWTLRTYPLKQIRNHGSNTFSVRLPSTEKLSDEKIFQAQKDLLKGGFGQIGQRLTRPPAPAHYRQVCYQKGDSEAKRLAHSILYNQDWSTAEMVWKKRLEIGSATWREYNNLGIREEKKLNFKEARRLYQEAERRSAGDEDAKRMNWSKLYQELDQQVAITSSLHPVSSQWFSRSVVVLPFSDETTSLNAPDMVRALVAGHLRDKGYTVRPLNEVDEILNEHGFSDAGQFAATTPVKLAKWTNADWLVFGHLEKFNDVNVGIFTRRSVGGQIRIWNASTQQDLWIMERPVVIESSPKKSQDILSNFLLNLGRTFVEKLAKSHMGEEANLFSELNLETFPSRY